jgi:hypothetical protein
VDCLFALPGQLLENGPARRIGEGAEHVIGIGRCHRQTITAWLCVVKKKITIFDCGLLGKPVNEGHERPKGMPRHGRLEYLRGSHAPDRCLHPTRGKRAQADVLAQVCQ